MSDNVKLDQSLDERGIAERIASLALFNDARYVPRYPEVHFSTTYVDLVQVIKTELAKEQPK